MIELQDDSSILEVSNDDDDDNKENLAAQKGSLTKANTDTENQPRPLKRKETRGGVKLDDTIELSDASADEGGLEAAAAAEGQQREDSEVKGEIGDGASDVESVGGGKTEHFTTANDVTTAQSVNNGDVTPSKTLSNSEVNFSSFVTSTPAVVQQINKVTNNVEPANYTYEHNETARVDDIEGRAAEDTTDAAVAAATTASGADPFPEEDIHDEMCDSYDEKVSLMTSRVPIHEGANDVITSKSDQHQEDHEEVSTTSQSPVHDEHQTDDEPADDELSEDNDDDEKEDSLNMSMPSKKSRRMDLKDLPETCTLLTMPNGGRVYLVGTAHFSQESNEDVAKVIQAVQPDIVVLELCKSRTSVLHLDEERSLELAQNLTLDRMMEMIKEQGAVQGMMTITMLSMSAHLTKELGMAPGGEFRRAYREAKHIPGCLVHLGDRPIQVTLRRAVGSLSVWQMLKLGFTMLTSKVSITKDEVEKYKQKDILEAMLEEMAGEFPSFTRVLVEERDIFLAHSMRLAADAPWRVTPQNDAGSIEAPVVVGVVGIGHMQGIAKNWDKVTNEDVARVVKIPAPTRSQRWTKVAIKTSFVLLSLYGGYRLLRNPMNRLAKILIK